MQVLQGLTPKISSILNDQPLSISLGSLRTMNQRTNNADVLYMNVVSRDSDRDGSSLENFRDVCEEVATAYIDAGLFSANEVK